MLINTGKYQSLVSVVIPTYNRCYYLKQAIDSAIKQTYQNIEIIVSDNCSIDDTQEIVESFPDPRIKYWQHNENIGMIANQLHALKMARGKYVASLHDDDIWECDFLAKLVPILEKDDSLVIAFCDQLIINSEGIIDTIATERYSRIYQRSLLEEATYKPFIELGLINKSIPTAAACVIRRDFIDWDKIPTEVGGMWDLYLTYLCCIDDYGAFYLPQRLAKYREHLYTDTMQSGRRNTEAKIRKAKSEIFCYQQFMEDKKLKSFYPYFQKKYLDAHTTLAIGLLKIEQLKAARTYIWKVIKSHNFSFRNLSTLILSYIPQKITNQLLKSYR
ncbi:Glycosyltransferase PglI [Richelia intracellularis HM01]|uniref:glycosyltransferase family 2 protein n=1 Tax=Richelia intracellularis TaxID=1164990 RepID=UPI0002B54318|nr:glycosyltransferase [Richelia intracellularis]CCH65306.1 Glycosyltransferase PglI [Richelia intracellularis HM01]